MASGMEEDQPAWAADVETYVSVDRASAVSDEDRDEAAGRIVQLLVSGALTFLDLLRGMETCLVTTDEPRRARGVLLLAECVAGYAGDDETVAGGARPLPGGAASLLSQYFASKLEDFAVLRAALAGCTALLRATPPLRRLATSACQLCQIHTSQPMHKHKNTRGKAVLKVFDPTVPYP